MFLLNGKNKKRKPPLSDLESHNSSNYDFKDMILKLEPKIEITESLESTNYGKSLHALINKRTKIKSAVQQESINVADFLNIEMDVEEHIEPNSESEKLDFKVNGLIVDSKDDVFNNGNDFCDDEDNLNPDIIPEAQRNEALSQNIVKVVIEEILAKL